MKSTRSQSGSGGRVALSLRRLYGFLAPRAYSVIMFGALFCTLAVKLFHSLRAGRFNEYFSWILADLVVLLGMEFVLALLCFLRPRKVVVRIAVLAAAIVCTWSVFNAGWLIATGTQILPSVLEIPLLMNLFPSGDEPNVFVEFTLTSGRIFFTGGSAVGLAVCTLRTTFGSLFSIANV